MAGGRPRTLPFDQPLLMADVALEIGGATVSVSRPTQFRTGDRVRGELRRNVNVVPAVSVGLDSRLLIVPSGSAPNTQRIVVRTTSYSVTPMRGSVRLRLPAGWTAEPAEVPLSLASEGDADAATFVVKAPSRRTPGSFDIVAEAVVGGATYSRDVQTIAYPHIQTHRVYSPAVARVQVFDLKVAAVKVGYIMGSGDQVPEALRRMGLDVTLIDPDLLATGDLSRFDTIVVGVRASEARPDFVANHGRLREYMERGGTLIVQYQQTDYVARNLPPYPVKTEGNPRVTDETARGHDSRAAPSGLRFAERRSRRPTSKAGCRIATSTRSVRSTGATPRCSRRRILARSRSAAARSTPMSARDATSTRPTRGSVSCPPACPVRIGCSPIL